MSFQLENPHPQPKNKPYIISSNLHEIHHDYDDDHLLISKVIPNPITLDLFHINQSSSLHKFENTSFDTKVFIIYTYITLHINFLSIYFFANCVINYFFLLVCFTLEIHSF